MHRSSFCPAVWSFCLKNPTIPWCVFPSKMTNSLPVSHFPLVILLLLKLQCSVSKLKRYFKARTFTTLTPLFSQLELKRISVRFPLLTKRYLFTHKWYSVEICLVTYMQNDNIKIFSYSKLFTVLIQSRDWKMNLKKKKDFLIMPVNTEKSVRNLQQNDYPRSTLSFFAKVASNNFFSKVLDISLNNLRSTNSFHTGHSTNENSISSQASLELVTKV